MTKDTGIRVVHVTHNARAGALVRSQVMPYVEGLRTRGIAVELVTFEPSSGGWPAESSWWPVPRRRGAGLFSKAVDILRGIAVTVRLGRRASLLQARSYVPAAMTLIAGWITRRPFIFDMRGFLPDEYVDAGYWSTADIRFRALRLAERYLLGAAAEIVVLTEAAARRLRTEPRFVPYVGSTPVTVIPCMVDLARFRPAEERDPVPTLLYTGSVGSFYEVDAMLAVYRDARDLLPGLRFLIVNRADHEHIRAAIARLALEDTDIVVRAADLGEMPALVARAHVGIALLRQAPSKSGSSPIKLAEYLACGLPVIVNAGLGDADEQIRAADAGHVMADYGAEEIRVAARAVARLVGDVAARARARALAEREYDLETGVRRYAEIFARVSGGEAV